MGRFAKPEVTSKMFVSNSALPYYTWRHIYWRACRFKKLAHMKECALANMIGFASKGG